MPDSANCPRLRILVVSQFFTPEMGAPAARFHDFGRMLVARGHRVSVLTAFPNSPSGIIPREYRGRLRQRETIDSIEVLRGWIYASPRLSPRSKMFGSATFTASASLWALLGDLDADVVVATGPPPTVGIPGFLAARRLGASMVFDVRDIWPEALQLSGRLRSGPLVRALEWTEDFSYRQAAAVTVVTEGKKERLIEKGVPEKKIEVVPNGVDLSRFDGAEPDLVTLRAYGVDPTRFIVLYAGVFNPPQGLDVLLDAAKLLRQESSRLANALQLVMIGDGSERERLQRRCAQEHLNDVVVFVPVQPRDRIPGLLRAADAVAIPLRPRRDSHTMPSKIYESLASGRPVLVSADGAPAAAVMAADAGLATGAGDSQALAGSIRRLVDDPELCRRLGARGAAFAKEFDRRVLVERFEQVLASAVAESR